MKLDLNYQMRDEFKQVIQQNNEVLTLARVFIISIKEWGMKQEDAELKYKLGKLSERILDGGVQDFSLEELTQLKKVVGAICVPTIVAQVWDYIEKKDD